MIFPTTNDLAPMTARKNDTGVNLPKGWILWIGLDNITWHDLATAVNVAKEMNLLNEEVDFEYDDQGNRAYITIEQPQQAE